MGLNLALITPYHVGAVSVVRAFAAAGYSVCAPEWIPTDEKIAQITRSGDCDLIWAHWLWVDRCPDWLLDREVITILRDPVECAISDYLRGNARKAGNQAAQWKRLREHMHRVNYWADFLDLDFSRWGVEVGERHNATPDHELKQLYARGDHGAVRGVIEKQWRWLMTVDQIIREVFICAGLSHRLAGTPFEGAT